MCDVVTTQSTWPDAGRHLGQKMAAIQTGNGDNRCRATLGQVVSGTSESSIVENVGVAAEIALPSMSALASAIITLPSLQSQSTFKRFNEEAEMQENKI